MRKISKESKELKGLTGLLDRFRTVSLARGHVSYLCASRRTKVLVSTPSASGFKTQLQFIARPTWIISGRGTTSAAGQATIDVGEYLHVPECAPVREVPDYLGPAIIDERPAFLTSIHSEAPVVVGTKIEATAQEGRNIRFCDMFDGHIYDGEVEYKVTATVRTWKPDGATAAGVEFSWVCIAEGASKRWREM